MTHPHKPNRDAWGRHSRLRNAAHSSINCVITASTRRVAQAGVGLCACAVASAPSPLTSSRGPFTGRRMPLRFSSLLTNHRTLPSAPVTAGQRSGSTRQLLTLCSAPVVAHSTISNRSTPRLELPESCRKQTTAPLSNRHKFTRKEHIISCAGSERRPS
jgi:hypothetical protein